MIYVTGDTHGRTQRFNTENLPFGKDDYYIVCGDFGFVWRGAKDKYWLDWLATKPYTILFVDGNHENFDALYAYPKTVRFGAEVHEVRHNVLHLIRGNIYTIDDYTFLAMGGASSHDKEYINPWTGKAENRVEGIDWWPQEDITDADMENAINNLVKVNWEVDYVISHEVPTNVKSFLGFMPDANTNKLEQIYNNLKFDRWFFGHYHQSIRFYNFVGLYEEMVGLYKGQFITQ